MVPGKDKLASYANCCKATVTSSNYKKMMIARFLNSSIAWYYAG